METQLQSLGKAIRTRRKMLKLTQTRLAMLSGCKPLFIHEIEKGKTNPRLSNLLQLLKVLGLQVSIENGKQGLEVRTLDAID